MKNKLEKLKEAAKRHGVVILSTAAVTAIAVYALTREEPVEKPWDIIVVSEKLRDTWKDNPDACVAFDDAKIIVTGQEWNPDK